MRVGEYVHRFLTVLFGELLHLPERAEIQLSASDISAVLEDERYRPGESEIRWYQTISRRIFEQAASPFVRLRHASIT